MSISDSSASEIFNAQAAAARTKKAIDFYQQPKRQRLLLLRGTLSQTLSHLAECADHEVVDAHLKVPSSKSPIGYWRIGETPNTVRNEYDRWFLGRDGGFYLAVKLYGAEESALCVKRVDIERLRRRTAVFIYMNLLRMSDHP